MTKSIKYPRKIDQHTPVVVYVEKERPKSTITPLTIETWRKHKHYDRRATQSVKLTRRWNLRLPVELSRVDSTNTRSSECALLAPVFDNNQHVSHYQCWN